MAEQYGYRPSKILVIEDHKETAQVITIVLEDEGFGVVVAENALIARDVLLAAANTTCGTRACPDLVLMDLTMPGLDPLEMVQGLGQGCAPPVVLMSAKPAYALEA